MGVYWSVEWLNCPHCNESELMDNSNRFKCGYRSEKGKVLHPCETKPVQHPSDVDSKS